MTLRRAFALLLAVTLWAGPATARAGRPEPVTERPERGRVAVTVVGKEFDRPGTYYVGQDASLNDLLARAGLDAKRLSFVWQVLVERERDGKKQRFRLPVKTLDLQFDFQDGDRVHFLTEVY